MGVSGLKTISIGDSSKAVPGTAVMAIGNALGQGGTPAASQGVIAATDQTITADDGSGNAETLSGMLQVQALIQPGDSGGPLVNMSGNVIGMDTAAQVSGGRFARDTGSTNGYAIPISTAMSIVKSIETGGAGAPQHPGGCPGHPRRLSPGRQRPRRACGRRPTWQPGRVGRCRARGLHHIGGRYHRHLPRPR